MSARKSRFARCARGPMAPALAVALLLGGPLALAGGRGLACGLFAILGRPTGMGRLAQLGPIRLGHVDVVMLGGLLDVGEGDLPVVVRNVDGLVETRNRVPDMSGGGKRLLPLLGKCKDAVRQIAPLGERAVLLVRLPSGFHVALHSALGLLWIL